MGRPPRIHYEGALYHVFPRGNRRERIFETDRDYRTLEKYMIETAQATGAVPRCWYPMPNHIHAMIETPLGNISEFMHRWLGRYARYYNWVHGKIGHLFQGRYGSRLVQSDAYQKELVRYIHLNPYRSKNPQNLDPLAGRYSSHRYYMGETCPPIVWSWIEPMLKLFGEDLESARKNYAQFLADGLQRGDWQDFYKPKGGILGHDNFVQQVRTRQQKEEITSVRAFESMTLEQLMDMAVHTFGWSLADLKSVSQRRDLGRVRQAIAYVGRLKMRFSAVRLGHQLNRDHSAISQMIQRARQKQPPELARLLDRLQLSHSHA